MYIAVCVGHPGDTTVVSYQLNIISGCSCVISIISNIIVVAIVEVKVVVIVVVSSITNNIVFVF